MYNFGSSLFQYRLIFIFELIISELMIGVLFRKRERFVLRTIIFTLLSVIITFALPIFFYNAYYIACIFTTMFMMSVFLLKICYNESFSNLLLCGIFAYTAQHISYVLGNFVSNLIGLEEINVYAETSFTSDGIFALLISFIFYVIIYASILLFVKYKKNKEERIVIGNVFLIFVALAMLLVNVYMNAIISYKFTTNFDKVFLLVYTIYDTVCAVFIIGMLIISMTNASLKNELSTIHLLWERDKKVYQIKKEKMDSVAILCHDLRHRLNSLSARTINKEELQKLENELYLYEGAFKTGNDVMDIILSETEMYCKEHQIDFVYIGDASMLNFISETDLYSLFDNLLHNAIEATEKIKDKEERFIYFSVKKKGKLIYVLIENSFDEVGKIVFNEDGLPLSSQENQKIHGYGMKSIKLITETYGGNININVDNKIFKINLIFTCND